MIITVAGRSFATTDIARKELAAWQGGSVVLQKKSLKGMKRDAYRITVRSGNATITSPSDIQDSPFHDIRPLNHWDNLDGNSERGYAGKSI